MLKVSLYILSIWVLFCNALIAQNYPKNPNKTDKNGLRQGNWTIFYDAEWNVVDADSKEIYYYRLISYKDDKPNGIVKDFYKNGGIQSEGGLVADRPKEIKNGECIFYAENGKKVSSYIYNKSGEVVNSTYFDKQGNVTTEHFEVYVQKADELFDAKKYTEALKWYLKAKESAMDICGRNSSYYAEYCDEYAFCLSKVEKDKNKIVQVYRETVEIYESINFQKTQKYAQACYSLAYEYNKNQQPDNAEKYHLIAQTILEQTNKTNIDTYFDITVELFNIYHNQAKYDKAEKYCEKLLKMKKEKNETETSAYTHYLYKYAFYQKRKGNYTEVEKMMNDVISINAKLLGKRFPNENKTPNVISGIPQKVKKTNMGTNINTKYAEILPIISADGKILYFDRKYAPENINGEKDSDDIYFSVLQSDGTWSKAQNIGKPLNNSGANAAISVTPDNNMLMVSGVYSEDGTKPMGNGISYALRTEKGWDIPKKITIKNYVNKSDYVYYSLSADGKTLFLAIETNNTFGKRDIYVSFLQEDGTWSEPKNLGKQINTPDEEESPFLAPDGVTLYYSTSGLPGYGSKDIFVSKRLDDTWTNWSEPQNLGHEINTDGIDAFFVIPASGKYAYMSSNFESIGANDLIQIELPDVLKPKAVVLVKGKVIDNKTKKPLSAKITYRDLKTDAVLGIANSSPLDGSYQIVLPSGNIYSFFAEKNGYIATSNNLNLEKLGLYKEIEQNLLLTPIEVGQTVRLNNIFFDTDKYELKPESTAELNRLIRILNQNSELFIEISGHTDATGNDQHNLELSQKRADAVKNYLLTKGISADRLISKGYGKLKSVADNNTEEGRQQNRRVEFTILK